MTRPASRYALLMVFIASFLAAIFFLIDAGINHFLDEEREKILFALHLRADSLASALEGAARSMGRPRGNLSDLMAEIGRQPGVAWIALVSPEGRIIQDSNPELAGSLLYTPGEMGELRASSTLQGRFSIDDPDVYETWKLFAPGRLRGQGRHGAIKGDILFVALNAANFMAAMSAYRIHLWLIAGLGTTALCACAALIYYIRNYLLSHRKLKDTEAMAEQVILSYPASLIVTNPIGEVIFKNRRAEKILTYMSAQIPFQEWRGFDWSGLYKDLQAGKIIVDAERELLEPSGRLLPVNLSASPLWDSSGKCTGYLIVISDLSEMKRLKRRLAETQRLSALGHLATGLAHEIRNPLSSICGYACYLEEKLQSDPLGLATAKLLVDESRRLNNVLSELLQLAREPRLDIRTHPVSELLRKVRKVALPDAESRRINLTIAKESEERISASIDPDRMLQALLNLVLNAIQATPAGGDVLLSAEFLPAHSPVLPIELDQEEGWWRIQVRDSGRGMTEKELAQIFTPYFTTRANGTGLGLPIARRIVEAHDGLITAESKLGAGAVFSIYIPQKAKE